MYEDMNGTKIRPPILREVEYGSGKQSFCLGTLRATLNLCYDRGQVHGHGTRRHNRGVKSRPLQVLGGSKLVDQSLMFD